MCSLSSPARQVPEILTPLPGPKAAALIARDDGVLSPSFTRPYPLAIARGAGCTVEDVDGNLFLDFTAGIAVNTTGHAHPEVVAAIGDQASRFLHMSGTDFYYAAQVDLAERLAKLAPGSDPKRVFFTNSGAETVEAALKLARYHTGRHRVISFQGAFHGRTYGALSVCGSKAVHQRRFGPSLPGVSRLRYDCDEAEFEQLFATTVPPEEVAAIIVEPIQGEGGYRVPSPGFLPLVRRICDEHGIVLVVDEIQAGMGRTGRMFACEHWNIEPDFVCLAKGIASGLPLGALVTKAAMMDWQPGAHASTFGGNPLACRAALVTLDLLGRELLENARQRGEQLRAGLEGLEQEFPAVRRARGLGLMQAIDLYRGESPAADLRDAFELAAFHRGLLLLGCGKAGIRFAPPLCVSADEVRIALNLLRETAAELSV